MEETVGNAENILYRHTEKNGAVSKLYYFMQTVLPDCRRVDSCLCIEMGEEGVLHSAYIADMGRRENRNYSFFEAFATSGTSPRLLYELFEEQEL